MVIAIPLMAAMSFATRNLWQRLAYACVFCLSLAVQFIAYMRAGWLSLLVQGVALAVIIGGRRLGALALVCCLVGVLGLFVLSEAGYLQGAFDPTSFHYRLEVWQLGIGEVMKHPIVGLGYGNDTLDKRFEDYWKTGRGPILHSPHSLFLMIAMGSGIPALILITWVLVSAIRYLVSSASKVSDRVVYALTIGVAIMVIGFAVRNLFDYMFAGSLAYLFWILVAVGMAEVIKARKNHQAEERTGSAVAATQCP